MKFDISAFCDGVPTVRYADIDKPFVRDGYEYATDARLMIWRKTRRKDSKWKGVPLINQKWCRSMGLPKDPQAVEWKSWPRRVAATGAVWFRNALDTRLEFDGMQIAGQVWIAILGLPGAQYTTPPEGQKGVALKWREGFGLLMQCGEEERP